MLACHTGWMLSSSTLTAFVGVKDPDRAKKFYRDTLGLKLTSEQLPFALVFNCQDTALRVTIVPKVVAAPYTVLGWQVPDIAAAVTRLQAAGIQFQRYSGMKQDDLGVWQSPSGARVAWFQDPDGNLLSITQP